MDTIPLPEPLRELAEKHFTLLERESPKHKRDTLGIRLSGYADVGYLINDIVKVCILALGDGETHSPRIPQPESNVSGVLMLLLDLLPFEEFDLLDKLRESILDPQPEPVAVFDEVLLESISLLPPSALTTTN